MLSVTRGCSDNNSGEWLQKLDMGAHYQGEVCYQLVVYQMIDQKST